MVSKCSKMGFLVCLLALLILICTWFHMSSPEFVTGVTSGAMAKKVIKTPVVNTEKISDDLDGDGIDNDTEKKIGLNPELSDTDGDGITDGKEGVDTDTDGDGIIDALESALDDSDLDGVADQYDAENTNPDNDSDGDGYGNGLEKAEGSDPLDAKSMPADKDKDGIPDSIDVEMKPVSFEIDKMENSVDLKGLVGNNDQIDSLKKAFEKEGFTSNSEEMKQGKGIEDKVGVIELTKKIAPLFLSYYNRGAIKYSDGIFKLSGEVASEEQKAEMENLLLKNAGSVEYKNDTNVTAPPKPAAEKESAETNSSLPAPNVSEETNNTAAGNNTEESNNTSGQMGLKPKAVEDKSPISFEISKDGSLFIFEGKFADIDQISAIQNIFDDEGILYKNGSLTQNEHLEGNLSVILAQKLIPHFAQRYKKGSITYTDGKMIVDGEVPSENDKNMMERLLAANAGGIEYVNNTVVITPVVVSAEVKNAFTNEIEDLLSIEKISFETASAKLTREGMDTVKKVGVILSKYKDIRLELAGYTDSDGDDDANLKLSQQRVESVKKALIGQGIDPFRIRAKGYGESNPVVPNDSADNKAKNRRVEFHIIGE